MNKSIILEIIAPKSDQLNADDLIGGEMTICVRAIGLDRGNKQPLAIFYEGDGGKPFKACKTMGRLLVYIWGPDVNTWVGKSMTLFRDPKVMYGAVEMGGIRISHVSGIKVPITLALTEKRGSRKPYTVLPLVQPEPNAPTPANVEKARDAASKGMAALKAFWDALDAAQQKFLKPYMGELKETATNADKAAASAPAFADVGAQFEAEQRGRADYAAGIIKLPDEYKGAEKEALAEAWFKGWDKAKASAEVAPAEPVELVADRDAEMAKLRDAA